MSQEALLPLPSWHYLNGKPTAKAVFKQRPEDFQVTELMEWQPKGEGEHLWLRIRKQGMNTADLCQKLASAFSVHRNAVGYAGLKDKHSVSEQWLSVQLPGKQIDDPAAFLPEGVTLLEHARHDRKLRPGSNRGNQFVITLRELALAETGTREAIEQRLEKIRQQGVPNYFGEQRFGYEGNNIRLAQRLFSRRKLSRNRRSMALSAARSYLFNQVLSQRIEQGAVVTAMAGEALLLSGSNAFFAEQEMTPELQQRLVQGDLLLSAPLWGRGELPSLGAAREMELAALQGLETLMEGLEKAGLKQERRALLLVPQQMRWAWVAPDQLQLSFSLPRGCFATSVLRELVEYIQPQEQSAESESETGQDTK